MRLPSSFPASLVAIVAVNCSIITGCTLDDGQLTQTVPLERLQGTADEFECHVRIQNVAGDVRIEARQPQSTAPQVAQIPASRVAASGPSDAVIHWVGETDQEGIGASPRMFFDDNGVLVIEGGCDSVDAAVNCRASIDAWIPAACDLEVHLGVGDASTVVGFSGNLDLRAEEANVLTIDHDGDARIDAEHVHGAVFFCGEGAFEFDVGGDVVACDEAPREASETAR